MKRVSLPLIAHIRFPHQNATAFYSNAHTPFSSQAYVAKQFNVADPATIISFGFRTQFGGARSSGFCLIYENLQYLKMFEPRYRQIRAGLKSKVEKSRKQLKEAKNRGKKVWGTGRRAALKKERRAAAQE